MGTGKEIKRLRLKAHLSAEKAAGLIGIDAERLRKWEAKDLEPRADDAKTIKDFFGLELDQLNTLQSFNFFQNVPRETSNDKKPFHKERQENKMTVSTYLVPLVQIKAQAGYIMSHEFADFIEELEKYPMAPGINPRGTEWRWFEVQGESMEPTLFEGDYILCSFVPGEDWKNLEDYYLYVVVTQKNLWIKRIVKNTKDKNEILLFSDNKKVKPRPVRLEDIKEVWKVRRHLNARMPPPEKIIINNQI
jgi:phage repressor protein C with HTH and peptisase S24 domain